MGENGPGRAQRARVTLVRVLGSGTTGFATAVTLLMVLAPGGSGLAGHSTVVLTPGYAHTVASPTGYWMVDGCAKTNFALPHWNPSTGAITGVVSSLARTCAGSMAGGSNSFAYFSSGISLSIPFRVLSTGNHTITTSFNLKIASSEFVTTGGCPAKRINYAPTIHQVSSGHCQSGATMGWHLNVDVVDLNKASWYSNNSYADASNSSYWQNYTTCSNHGTVSCSNTTRAYGYSSNFSYNAAGFSTFSWNGGTSLTTWANGTNMIKSHHFELMIDISAVTSGFTDYYNLLGHWAGRGAAQVNMGTLGNGVTINSISIT